MGSDLATLIYDGDCGFCQQAVDWLAIRTDESVRFTPRNASDLAHLGLRRSALDDAAVLVSDDAPPKWGADAIGEVLRRSPIYGNKLLGRLILEQPSKTVAGWIYRWVAANRFRLSGSGTCRAMPD